MNRMAYISDPRCQDHDMGPEHPEQPARVRAIADRLALTGLLDQLDCLTAFPATNEQLLRVHTRAYLDFLKSSVPLRGFFPLDEDTFLTPLPGPVRRAPCSGPSGVGVIKRGGGYLVGVFYCTRSRYRRVNARV